MGEIIKQLRESKGLTQEELGKLVGVKKAAVQKWEKGITENLKRTVIKKLSEIFEVDSSYLLGLKNKPHTIISYKTKKVPLLGDIAAGEPIYAAEETTEYYIEVDEDLNVNYCVRVKGDSMKDARINDGDIVFIREQPTVENGEIAAVLIDNEVTLKRFYKTDGGIILKPESSKYQPIFYTEQDFKEIRILGKAVFFQSKI